MELHTNKTLSLFVYYEKFPIRNDDRTSLKNWESEVAADSMNQYTFKIC